MGKRTAQKDITIDTTSDSQVNSNFPNRWSPASLTFTGLYIIVENPDDAAELLNADLRKITTWAEQWLVTFNPPKTESMLISRKIIKPVHPPIFMSN